MSFIGSLSHGIPTGSQTGLSSSTMYTGSQLNSHTYLSRVPSLPDTSHMYSLSSSSHQDTIGYNPMQSQSESLKAPVSVGQHYFVDHLMKPHPYSSLYPGFDINAIRRKNTTRETTGPLKAWLKQHRQNPYPTKGEKVMLAISTRMTLTQVSTWFANARRRMKKDKFDEQDEERGDMADLDGDKKRERSGSVSSWVSHTSSESDTSKDLSDMSDVEEIQVRNRPPKKCVQRLFTPDMRLDHVIDPSSSPEIIPESPPSMDQSFPEPRLPALGFSENHIQHSNASYNFPPQKPKIWSISEIIGSTTQTVSENISPNDHVTAPSYLHFSNYYSPPVTDYSYQEGNVLY